MPIYIGDKEIATVFKGDTELDNIRLGDQQQWIGIIVTPDPSIAYVSRTTNSLTFDLTNNHEEPVTIYYEIDDNTPDQNSVVVAANATQRVTLSGLSLNTTYTLFAYALETEQLPSNTVSNTQTTQDRTENPSIFNVNPDVNSVTFSLRNNDNITANIRYEVNDATPDISVSVGAGQTVSRTISGLNDDTNYTLYARALANDKIVSSTVSTGFKTDIASFEVGTITYDNVSYAFSQFSSNFTITFSTTGHKLFIATLTNDRIHQYSLSTPFDISTMSYDNFFLSVGAQEGVPFGVNFNPTGTKMFVIGTGSGISQYSLSSPFNISSATYDNVSFDIPQDKDHVQMRFNNTGTKMFVNGFDNETIYQYSLSSPYNIASVTYDNVSLQYYPTPYNDRNVYDFVFNNTGTKLYLTGPIDERLAEWTLSTPFNLATASFTGTKYNFGNEDGAPYGLQFNTDGSKMFMYGGQSRTIFQYTNVY